MKQASTVQSMLRISSLQEVYNLAGFITTASGQHFIPYLSGYTSSEAEKSAASP